MAEKYNPEPGVEPEALVERTSALPTELFKSYCIKIYYLLKNIAETTSCLAFFLFI